MQFGFSVHHPFKKQRETLEHIGIDNIKEFNKKIAVCEDNPGRYAYQFH